MKSKIDGINKSGIDRIHWRNCILTIYYDNGQVTRYSEVPEGIYEGLRTAESPGAYIRFYISPIFPKEVIKLMDEKHELEKLRHFKDTLVGTWATDRPDLIPKDLKERYFWEIKL